MIAGVVSKILKSNVLTQRSFYSKRTKTHFSTTTTPTTTADLNLGKAISGLQFSSEIFISVLTAQMKLFFISKFVALPKLKMAL